MLDRYGHFVDEMRKEAADQMENALKPLVVNLVFNEEKAKIPEREVIERTGATRRD